MQALRQNTLAKLLSLCLLGLGVTTVGPVASAGPKATKDIKRKTDESTISTISKRTQADWRLRLMRAVGARGDIDCTCGLTPATIRFLSLTHPAGWSIFRTDAGPVDRLHLPA
jgi:hypothetical protein